MARRQYVLLPDGQANGNLCAGVEPALGAGVLAAEFGSGGHGACTSTVRVGALRLWPAGQREGGDGAPPRGRRPTVVGVRTWVRGAEGCGNAENSSTGPGALAPDVWAASRAPDSNGREYSCGAAARHPTGPEVSRGPVIVGFRERYPMGDWETPLRPPYSSLM